MDVETAVMPRYEQINVLLGDLLFRGEFTRFDNLSEREEY